MLHRTLLFRLLLVLSLFSCLTAKKSHAQPNALDSIGLYYNLEDVVVTAQYAPTDSRQSLYKIRSIKRDVMETRGTNTLEQLLNQELNIRISQDLILGSSLNLQGVSGQNVKIMIDGVPVIGRVGDDIDLSQISLSNIERVEIIEGPVSVNYGTNALGGVINLITKKSQLHPLDLRFTSQIESIGSRFINGQYGFKPSAKILLRGDAGYQEFDGFNPVAPEPSLERTFQWNPKTQGFFNQLVRFDLGQDRQLRWNTSFFMEEIENLGPVRRPQFKPYAFDEYYLTRRFDQTLTYEGSFKKDLYWHITGAWNTFRREKQSLRLDLDSAAQTEIPAEQDTTRYQAFVFRPVLASRFSEGKLNFQAGLDINHEIAMGKRFNYPGADASFRSQIGDYAGFFTLTFQPIAALDVQLGARAAYNTRFDAPIVPSLHLKYDFSPNWQLRASYASGFRSPSVKELFFYFVDASHFIVGNPDLGAETSQNIQGVLDFRQEGKQQFQFTLTGFFNDIQNKIQLFDFVEQDGVMIPAASLGQATTRFAYFNQERYKTLGVNIRAGWKWKNLSLDGGIAPTGSYNPLSATVAEVADYTFTTEMSGQLGYRIPGVQLEGQFFIRYNDRLVRFYQSTDTEGVPVTLQAIQDGFALADLVFTKKFPSLGLTLSSGVKNLFDITNVNTNGAGGGGAHSGGSSSPIATGINYFARLSWNLEKKP